mmetsp:Transcript_21290/g.64817  ORF Transcript_21290/g.64817 Transcript_21290/m.64817 type:complete len:333 (-) Transcript_21290:456-1454(-)
MRPLLLAALGARLATGLQLPIRGRRAAKAPHRPLGAPHADAIVFADEILGTGSYGHVVEALCSEIDIPSGEEDFVAVEACPGPSQIHGEWRDAAAKCAIGPGPLARSYLEIEAHANSRIMARYPPTDPTARFFMRYHGEARATAPPGPLQGRRWLIWDRCDGFALPNDGGPDAGKPIFTLEDCLDVPGGAMSCLRRLGFGETDAEALREVAAQIFGALAAVQALQIVHRDVKPENLMVSAPEEPGAPPQLRLVDFGSAADLTFLRSVGYDYRFSPITPKYCPPEEFLEEGAPYAFDSFSTGLTLLRLAFPAFADDVLWEDFLDDFEDVSSVL